MTEPRGWSSPDNPSERPENPMPAYPTPEADVPRDPAKPGTIPLRPLGFGEILDGAITTMRTYPKQTFGLSVLVSIVINLLVAGSNLYQGGGSEWIDGAVGAVTFTASVFLNGLIAVVVVKASLGKPVRISEAWRQVRPRFGALIVVSLLYTLVASLGMLALIIPGVWMFVAFSLASTVLILEGTKVTQSMPRSRDLVAGAWWRTFGILLLAIVIGSIVEYVVTLPVSLIAGTWGGVLLTAAASTIVQTFTLPFVSGVTALIYIDRRMRKEGMDIELARQAA